MNDLIDRVAYLPFGCYEYSFEYVLDRQFDLRQEMAIISEGLIFISHKFKQLNASFAK